jgi:ComF family protein
LRLGAHSHWCERELPNTCSKPCIPPRGDFRYNEAWRRWVFSSSRRAAIPIIGPSVVRSTSHALFSLFFPSDCRVCATPLEEISRIPVCSNCLKAPEPLSAEFFCISCRTPFQNAFPLDSEGRCALCRNGLRGFDAAYCYGAYEGPLRSLIHVYKYGGVRTLARPLSDLLACALPREESFDLVTPVPLHWRRQWQRGFNQSELLAEATARRCGIPLQRTLRRVRSTATQAGLSNTNRRKNVTAAFECRSDLPDKRVLLIDDVMTTGSTAASCALALKKRGAKRVALLTIARVDRRMGRSAAEAYSRVGGVS